MYRSVDSKTGLSLVSWVPRRIFRRAHSKSWIFCWSSRNKLIEVQNVWKTVQLSKASTSEKNSQSYFSHVMSIKSGASFSPYLVTKLDAAVETDEVDQDDTTDMNAGPFTSVYMKTNHCNSQYEQTQGPQRTCPCSEEELQSGFAQLDNCNKNRHWFNTMVIYDGMVGERKIFISSHRPPANHHN